MGKSAPEFDVVVVGSGASGGWACKRLSEAGFKVALVDAGRPHENPYREHIPRSKLPYRNLSKAVIAQTRPVQSFICTEFNYDWFCNDIEEPYTTAPGTDFRWLGRLRVVGGRTNVWGRVCLRLSDLDFKAASIDGYGVDWPVSYADIAPYYDLVEEYVGVCGRAEGIEEFPDGRFQPPMPFNCNEAQFAQSIKKKFNRILTPGRCANLTRALNGRAECHYCGPCENGCMTNSYFNSAFTTVADAMRTGRCTHVPNAMVHRVLMDADRNRATGIAYVDRVTRQEREVRGRVVVLCAQAIESVRILLNSASRQHPTGLANSSGALGRYLMDHVQGVLTADVPSLTKTVSLAVRPTPNHIVRFRNTRRGPRSKDFLRGYGMELRARVDFNLAAPGFGAAYKRAVRDPRTTLELIGFGERLPEWENRVEIDPDKKDVYGIPVVRFNVSTRANDRALVKDMLASGKEMLDAVGATAIESEEDAPAGGAVHEVGVARMGADPKTSVLTPFQQTHDVKNLFVMDGSSFPSSGTQNPTLTIMALCVRSCDYLIGEMKRSNL